MSAAFTGEVSVTARAPAKINLALHVGPPAADGYHPVATIYQAVSLYDLVTVEPAGEISVEVVGLDAGSVPVDRTNLAVRAVRALARRVQRPAAVRITITKTIPVAGGMAGGSADAAAALIACDALWQTRLDRTTLLALGATLGSDVPFALTGGTALGTGRGDRLLPALARGQSHWVVAIVDGGLGAAEVYATLDRLRGDQDVPPPDVDVPVTTALASGDQQSLGRALQNDLEAAALALRPDLRKTLAAGREAGALGGLVSGSGPTCAFLARNEEHALDLAVSLSATGACRTVKRVVGPVGGAQLVSP